MLNSLREDILAILSYLFPFVIDSTANYSLLCVLAYDLPPKMQRASSPYPDRAPSPYRVPSPYSTPSPYGLPYLPPTENLPSSNVQVGSTTYTTSTGPDGRTVYHHLKAVAASYQTPNGVVSGIQWVPTEAPVPSVGQSVSDRSVPC